MQVPLLDLRREYESLRSDLDRTVLAVMADARFINGPQVKAFEDAIAGYLGAKYAIGVASGTDALLLSLRAAGVGPGTEVITTTFSFFATAGAVANLGATPVFVDICEDTFNLDVKQVEAKITPQTKAIIPVHLFGQSADLDPLLAIARARRICLIEDAAQSLSSKYKGRASGTLGDMGIYSFYPTKNLGCPGDGGLIVTNSEDLNQQLRSLKAHGARVKYFHDVVGYNSRLDSLHAAVLHVKLPYLDSWSKQRRANAAYYNKRFASTAVRTPAEKDYGYHIYNQYSIMVDNRDGLKENLKSAGVGYEIYYPLPLHLQRCFQGLGYREGDLPAAESCARRVISIPIYPQLTESEREYVADRVLEFVA